MFQWDKLKVLGDCLVADVEFHIYSVCLYCCLFMITDICILQYEAAVIEIHAQCNVLFG